MDGLTNVGWYKHRRLLRSCAVPVWVLGAVMVSVLVSGCSSTTGILAGMPEAVGGLPANTPVRPISDNDKFPAVHDMPPPRPNSTLTPEQVKAVETEVTYARDRQRKQVGAPIPDDPPAPAATK